MLIKLEEQVDETVEVCCLLHKLKNVFTFAQLISNYEVISTDILKNKLKCQVADVIMCMVFKSS